MQDEVKKVYNKADRYYPVEEGYDKKVYENTFFSYLQIIGVFIAFYSWNSLMTWGLFEFGIWRVEEYTVFAIIVFLVTCAGLAIMIVSGTYVNQKKHLEEFLKTKISEKKARKEEEESKIKQKAEYDARLAGRAIGTAEGARI